MEGTVGANGHGLAWDNNPHVILFIPSRIHHMEAGTSYHCDQRLVKPTSTTSRNAYPDPQENGWCVNSHWFVEFNAGLGVNGFVDVYEPGQAQK